MPRHPLLRLALANLHRPGGAAARIVVSLGIGLSVMIAVALVEGNLAVEIGERLADGAPADFYVDIQPDQLAWFERIVALGPWRPFRAGPDAARPHHAPRRHPGRTGRGGAECGMGAAQRARPHLRRRAAERLAHRRRRVVAAGLSRSALDFVRRRAGEGHGAPGRRHDDGNLLGREITGRIANLRRIEWTRLGINFAIVFAPGTLEAAPRTHLAAVYAPPADAERIAAEITERFPNVTAIPVREALAAVAGIVARIGDAVRAIASVTLAAGVLVLGGALAAGHRRRVYDSVLLKVLGATPGFVAGMFLAEHLLLGLVTAGIASVSARWPPGLSSPAR